MAGSRTLKLSILADVDQLNKSLKSATDDVDTFGAKMGKAGAAIGAAFAAAAAAAGAYAVKIGIDGVKAAVADEKAQTQLALALTNATGATTAQIKATEDYILQTSLATGVTDDELRPALGRLARSTGDVSKAQELLSTALDISAATGKPVETVANALSKAYDGNTAALGKLGVGLSSAELKAMSFNDVQSRLSDLFGGAAAANADTYAGRIARMKVAFAEAQETIGYALLPILQKLMDFINRYATPAIQSLSNFFSGDNNSLNAGLNNVVATISNIFIPVWNGLVKAFNYIKTAISDNLDVFKEFGGYIAQYLAPVVGTVLGGALQVVGKVAGGVIDIIASVIKVINGLIGGAIDGINALIKAYNAIPLLPNIPTISKPTLSTPTVTTPSVPSVSIPKVPTISTPSGGGGGGVSSAAASGAAAAYVSENLGYNPLTGQVSGAVGSQGYNPLTGTVISPTINIGVAGDPEGVARTVVDVLNRSYGRGALGAEALLL